MHLSSSPISRTLGGMLAGAAIAPLSLHAVDNLWTGVVDTDWNNPGNWSDPHGFGSTHVPTNAAGHPGDEDAVVNTITPRIATITADLAATPRDIKVGVGGATGQVNHHAGVAATGGPNWMIIGDGGGANGTYNLANTTTTGGTLTGFGVGTGSASAGQLRVGLAGGTGTMAINTSGTLTVANDIFVGINATGIIKMDSGTVNRNTGWSAIGVGGGNGTFNQSGGTFTGANETVVGLDGGSQGFLNLTGGTYTASGNLQIGRAGATGTVNVSGATTQLDANAEIWVGENPGSNGFLTVNSGTVNVASWVAIGRNGSVGTLTVAGTGTLNQGILAADSRLSMTNFGQPTTATVNLDGGTLTTRGIIDEATGTSTVNLNGGVLKPRMNNGNFIANVASIVVKTGGAKIDTDGFDITINRPLTGGAGDGGLQKSGAGALLLDAVNTYTGATTVSAGTFGGNGSVSGAVSVASGAILKPGTPVGNFDAGAVTLSPGATLQIDANDNGAGRLDVTGNLTITNATLAVSPDLSSRVYIIATYGSRTGTFIAPALPGGYSINYTFSGNQIALTRAATAFDNFIDPLFPSNPNDPAFVGPNADPDSDGVRSFDEFALGGNPSQGGDRSKVFSLVADSNDVGTARELLLTIAVRAGNDGPGGNPVFAPTSGNPTATIDGITYTIQGSTDLLNFDSPVSVVGTVATGLPAAPAGYEYRTFRLNASDGLPSRGFMRVQISP